MLLSFHAETLTTDRMKCFFHTLAVKALHRLLMGVTRVLPLVIILILLTFYVVGMFVGQQCMMNRTLDMHGKMNSLKWCFALCKKTAVGSLQGCI